MFPIEAPWREHFGQPNAGVVHVLYGSGQRLAAHGSQHWHQDVPGVGETVGPSDLFGIGLGAGDFNGDGFHDLAIGAPGETVVGTANEGAVTVLYGGPGQLGAWSSQLWHQNVAGVVGIVEPNDRFGRSLGGGSASFPF